MLGIGRNTVREAIKTLTSTGVLEIRRGSERSCAPEAT